VIQGRRWRGALHSGRLGRGADERLALRLAGIKLSQCLTVETQTKTVAGGEGGVQGGGTAFAASQHGAAHVSV